jgi:hypothetical protein
MATLPTGTVTFLFTDIEGSTRLLQQLRDAYADVLVECRRLVRSAVQEGGGQEVDTEGDAVFAAFPSARLALSGVSPTIYFRRYGHGSRSLASGPTFSHVTPYAIFATTRSTFRSSHSSRNRYGVPALTSPPRHPLRSRK